MCRATLDTERRVALDAGAVGIARRFVHDLLCADHGADLVDTCVLLTSELVANAFRHGSTPVHLEVRCDASVGVEIRVSDGSPRAPVVQEPDQEALGGRGMLLVAALSDAWGVDPTPDGKVVWCRLDDGA